MSYKVVWTFAGSQEEHSFENEEDARHDAYVASRQYAEEYGVCETKLYDDQGQLIFDLRETHYPPG